MSSLKTKLTSNLILKSKVVGKVSKKMIKQLELKRLKLRGNAFSLNRIIINSFHPLSPNPKRPNL
jgi:hypothetical protein